METGSKAGIVCCSNSQPISNREQNRKLGQVLKTMGIEPVFGDYLYSSGSISANTAKQKAKLLMDFYKDDEIKAIFDISGGELANGVLPYLDYEFIAQSGKQFWGYSDLTTVINAIYAKTGLTSVLYQVRNLVGRNAERQKTDFERSVLNGEKELFLFPYEFIQGNCLNGVVVGGNIRCFLKLAGTPYMPDFTDKVLLLEAFSGGVLQMATYLNQLEQIGAFRKVKGILLGTFTQMEREQCVPSIENLIQQYVPNELCIVKTHKIGHGADSKAVVIGQNLCLNREA